MALINRQVWDANGNLIVDEWIEDTSPPPEAASPATIRIALRRLYGVTNAQLDGIVATVIDSLPADQQDDAETLWLYSVSIRRDHPLVAAVGAALNLTPAEVDDVFRLAATI